VTICTRQYAGRSPLLKVTHSCCIHTYIFRVGQNRMHTPYMTEYLVFPLPQVQYIHGIYKGLARTVYIRCTYVFFGRETIKYTVIYGVYIRFWPTLYNIGFWPTLYAYVWFWPTLLLTCAARQSLHSIVFVCVCVCVCVKPYSLVLLVNHYHAQLLPVAGEQRTVSGHYKL